MKEEFELQPRETGESFDKNNLQNEPVVSQQNNGVPGIQRGGKGKKSFVIVVTLEKKNLPTGQEPITPMLERNGASAPTHQDAVTVQCEDHDKTETTATEESRLLPADQEPLERNSFSSPSHQDAVPPESAARKEKLRCLKQKVVGQLSLWMIVLILLVVTVLAVVLGLLLWAALYEDEDDKFDRDSFVVPLFYHCSLRLVSQDVTEVPLFSLTSNQSRALIQEELYSLYSSSPALGRYFSGVGLTTGSHGNVTADYWLKFLMPQEHEQLLHYTLSREMVYNVLRQLIYDQEPGAGPLGYIDPTAIYMKRANGTLIDD